MLGKSPAWQDPGGACSGYLVEAGDRRVLLDCGNGVFAKLRLACDFAAVDAVVVSHLHADHFIDLVPFAYALGLAPGAGSAARRPALYAPPGAGETLRRVTGAWGSPELVEEAFELHEYDAGEVLDLGPLQVSFREVPHFILTHAVRMRDERGSFTFGADCGPNEAIVELARETDLLMLEATVAQAAAADGERGHLTAGEAGEHARRAGARRLVLTHRSADLDEARAREEAQRTFGAPVEVAHEGAAYVV